MSDFEERHRDPNFTDYVVEDVFHNDNGVLGLAVRKYGDQEGFGKMFSLPVTPRVEPQEGDEVRIYDDPDVGVRGADVNGENLYYWSKAEKQNYLDRQKEEQRREKIREFEENRDEMNATYEALPEPFRRRIDRFRRNNPEFRWKYEDYELFVCSEAVKMAEALGTAEAVEEFRTLSPKEQKELVNYSPMHSGNTFGMATILAYLYLSDPEDVVQAHGALAPLVGSEEYGGVPK